jgi:hypothetical protein
VHSTPAVIECLTAAFSQLAEEACVNRATADNAAGRYVAGKLNVIGQALLQVLS